MSINNDFNEEFNTFSSNYIREYAYKNGNEIYKFMNKNKIGHSSYGKLMDSAAKGKGVIAHRLYGHHLVYDFPVNDLNEVAPFLEHLLSDLFTKQGLPIIPGEILENLGLLKCCDSIKRSWNFVNGFDILAGTVAIFQGIDDFKRMFKEGYSIESIEDVAKTIGIGALELAIAMSTANPFLLIGGILSLTSGLKGMMNDGSVVYFANMNRCLSIEFSINTLNLEEYNKRYSIENSLKSLSIESSIERISFPYKF